MYMRIFFVHRQKKGAEEKISILRSELAPSLFLSRAITSGGS